MLKAPNGGFPVKEHLLRFHKTCGDTLERLHLESRKTFNYLALVIAHPLNVERRTALKLQRDQEREARSANERCKRKNVWLAGSVLEAFCFRCGSRSPGISLVVSMSRKERCQRHPDSNSFA
jgi:hypothetical protein